MTSSASPLADLDMTEVLCHRVLGRDLVDWAHRRRAVLPPMSPVLVTSRRVTLATVLEGIDLGLRVGDEGHLVRAAHWLLDQGVLAHPRVQEAIRLDRQVFAARELLREHALDFWKKTLLHAVVTQELPTAKATA